MNKDAKIVELVDSYGTWMKDDCENANRKGKSAKMTADLYPYDSMFTPVTVNSLQLKNRLVMAPMGNISMCDETGRPNDKMLQYFFARAKGGVGLITTGLVPVSHGIDNSITEMGHLSYFPRIDRSRTVFAGWRDLAQGVHAYGARIFIQLTPGLGRVGNPQCLINELKFPVSSSFNPNFYIPQIPCLPLTDGKLKKIIKNAGQAAADSLAMGIDGVYLHGHEGYLLEQMTNPAFNRRKIGRFANWQNFGLDMITEIRRRTGKKFPIMYRIDLSLALNETYGEDGMDIPALKKFKNGRTIEMTLEYMKNLVATGVDMFDVDLGCYDNWWLPHPPDGMPAGCFLDVARIVKEYFKTYGIKSNAGLEVPVVGVGKLGYPDVAEKALRDGDCDMVMLGRPLLADPEWCNKVYAGNVKNIIPCIGCQEGCVNEFVDGGHPQCAVNPRTGFEHAYPAVAPHAPDVKKIAVIGAGPAGITAALTAARRGHKVELYEKSNKIGGNLIPAALPKIKFDIANYQSYLENTLTLAAKDHVLSFKHKTELTVAEIKKKKFDAVIFAVGMKPLLPAYKGQEKVTSVESVALFTNPALMDKAQKIVIVGGGVLGCEVAYWLTFEYGKQVTVLEMLPHMMDGACTANRAFMIHYMHKAGTKLINCAKVTGFEIDKVLVERNVSKGVPNPYNTWQPILPRNIENPLAPKLGTQTVNEAYEADLVVFALGGTPDDAVYFEAVRTHAAPEMYNIGDSFTVKNVLNATRAGYALGIKI